MKTSRKNHGIDGHNGVPSKRHERYEGYGNGIDADDDFAHIFLDFLGKQERNHNPSGKHDEGPYPCHDGEKITAQKIFRNAHEVPRLGIDKIPGMEHYGIHPAKASIAGHEPVNDFIIMGGKIAACVLIGYHWRFVSSF